MAVSLELRAVERRALQIPPGRDQRGSIRFCGRLWFRGGVWIRVGGGRLPGIGVGGGFGVDAEIPDVEVHAFFSRHSFLAGHVLLAHHFDEGIFSGRETFGGSEFQPASADAGDGGFDQMLFLADFAGDLALHVADDALAVFDFGADDAKTVKGHDGLLRLLGTLCRCCGGILRWG